MDSFTYKKILADMEELEKRIKGLGSSLNSITQISQIKSILEEMKELIILYRTDFDSHTSLFENYKTSNADTFNALSSRIGTIEEALALEGENTVAALLTRIHNCETSILDSIMQIANTNQTLLNAIGRIGISETDITNLKSVDNEFSAIFETVDIRLQDLENNTSLLQTDNSSNITRLEIIENLLNVINNDGIIKNINLPTLKNKVDQHVNMIDAHNNRLDSIEETLANGVGVGGDGGPTFSLINMTFYNHAYGYNGNEVLSQKVFFQASPLTYYKLNVKLKLYNVTPLSTGKYVKFFINDVEINLTNPENSMIFEGDYAEFNINQLYESSEPVPMYFYCKYLGGQKNHIVSMNVTLSGNAVKIISSNRYKRYINNIVNYTEIYPENDGVRLKHLQKTYPLTYITPSNSRLAKIEAMGSTYINYYPLVLRSGSNYETYSSGFSILAMSETKAFIGQADGDPPMTSYVPIINIPYKLIYGDWDYYAFEEYGEWFFIITDEYVPYYFNAKDFQNKPFVLPLADKYKFKDATEELTGAEKWVEVYAFNFCNNFATTNSTMKHHMCILTNYLGENYFMDAFLPSKKTKIHNGNNVSAFIDANEEVHTFVHENNTIYHEIFCYVPESQSYFKKGGNFVSPYIEYLPVNLYDNFNIYRKFNNEYIYTQINLTPNIVPEGEIPLN